MACLVSGINPFAREKDRINIVLGPSGSVEGHLTHSLPSPQEVRIVQGTEEGGEALHVGFRSGKAVLQIQKD